MKGIELGKYYLMISASQEILEQECANLDKEIKLIDSYEYEPFVKEKKHMFEPFRSQQRQ
jgi:hypothetical protein